MVSQLKSLCHLFHQEKEALSLRHRWRFAEDGERFLLLSHETNSTFESVKYNRVIIGSPFHYSTTLNLLLYSLVMYNNLMYKDNVSGIYKEMKTQN